METALEPQLHRSVLGAGSRTLESDTLDGGVSALAEAALAAAPNRIDPTLDPSLQAVPTSPKAERLPSFRQLSKLAAAGEETGSLVTNGNDAPSPSLSAAVPAQPGNDASKPSSPATAPIFPDPAYDGQVTMASPTSQASHQPLPAAALAAMANSIPHGAAYPANVPVTTVYASPYFDQRRPSIDAYAPAPALDSQQSTSPPANLPLADPGQEHQPTDLPAPTAVMEFKPTANMLENLQPRPVAAPTPGTHVCEHPGCTAPPFQTQYLLNSHANVHSSNRPHFCAVEGCSRGPGGKGFKRKNEMIRHGLVHDSPGYLCPFCSDRMHKYPRPDNLQRHVRVHHVDKDKDDPELREVLSQRLDGAKSRRRRTGP